MASPGDRHGPVRRAYEDGFRGAITEAKRLLERGEAGPWAAALRAQLFIAGADGGTPPQIAQIRSLKDEAPEAAGHACVQAERIELLSLNRSAFEAWRVLHVDLAWASPEASLWLAAADIIADLLAGRVDALAERALEVERAALTLHIAPLVVEAAAVRAFALLTVGELEQATSIARRAARMARTEELPQPQYLANLVLARVRRFQNRSHLAVRILTALGGRAPALWRRMLRWELLFAGGPAALEHLLPKSEANDPAVDAAAFLDAAAHGTRSRMTECAQRVRDALGTIAGLSTDFEALAVAVDPLADRRNVGPSLWSWTIGQGDMPPHGLAGLAARAGAPTHVAIVASFSSSPARRTLSVGASLVGPILSGKRPGRVETAVAVLALSPEGLPRDELFRTVYGFHFVADLHQGTYDTMLYRVRRFLEGFGELVRVDDTLKLTTLKSFSVPDPRCEQPMADQLLRALAERGGGSAQELAAAVDMPLRTVQLLLKGLVEDGSCIPEKTGRRVAYSVEDTTFQEPTRSSVRTL